MEGEKFGKLTVIKKTNEKRGKSRGVLYLCRCDCGQMSLVRAWPLKAGTIKSCAHCCHKTHGQSKTREHRLWVNMKYRCSGVNGPDYANYGGRGIKVCDRWVDSFENFLADMGPAPSDKHSIERIRVSGDYGPGNCKWATSREQANNRRDNRVITYKGISKNLIEWSRELRMNSNTIRNRLVRGWTVDDAFNKPIDDTKYRKGYKTKFPKT